MPVSKTVTPDEALPVGRGLSGMRAGELVRNTSALTARYAVWIALAIVVVAGVVSTPLFATGPNLTALLQNMSILGIVAVGQTRVIAGGAMDLSVGMLMGLIVVLTNGIMQGDPQLALAMVALGLGVGLVVGLGNGFLLVLTRVPPLIL